MEDSEFTAEWDKSKEEFSTAKKNGGVKLSIFQRGIFQFIFSVVIASLFMYAGLASFIYLYGAGIFSQKAIIIFFGLTSALVIVAISFLVMKLTFGVNLATKVTLPKIVEFSHALQNIGIKRFDEQIDFIAREKVFVFVSDETIPSPYKENASVKRCILLNDKKKLKYLNGDKRLCLDAEDYERLLDEHGATTKAAFSARIVEMDQQVSELKAANSLHVAEIAKLTEENEKLLAENAGLQRKQQTAPSREGKVETSNTRRIPFWRVAGPLINRMVEEAQPDTKYTTTEIQKVFEAEIGKFPELKEAITKELHRYKQTTPKNELDLDGWAMDSIREGLGNFVQREPKRPKKTKKH